MAYTVCYTTTPRTTTEDSYAEMCHILNNVCMNCGRIISSKIVICSVATPRDMCVNQGVNMACVYNALKCDSEERIIHVDLSQIIRIVTVENRHTGCPD